MAEKRLDYIDTAKGILMICVVVAHVFRGNLIHNAIHVFHMPAFFIISGFLFNYSSSYKKSTYEFLVRRMNCLVIPFLFFEVLAVLWQYFANNNHQTIVGFTYNTLTLNVNSSTNWFIITLAFAEILFYFANKYLNQLAVISISVILFTITAFIPAKQHAILVILRVLLAFVFLVIGYYFFPIFNRYNRYLMIVLSFLVTVTVIFFNGNINPDGVDFQSMTLCNPVLFILGGVSGAILIINLSKVVLKSRILKYFGRNSLVVCGTQGEIYISTQRLFGVFDNYTISYWLGLLIIIITLFMALL